MLSNSCRYGIRAIMYLASQPQGKGKTGIKNISEDLKLPAPFLAKILQLLVKHKILSSLKGPNGGFSFSKDPASITLLEIVRIIDGEEAFTNCLIHDCSCHSVEQSNKICPVHEEYSRYRNDLKEAFSKMTIADLVKRAGDSEKIVI